MSSRVRRPSLTAVSSSGRLVSRPGKPGGGLGPSFSAAVCGAWSLAKQSITSRLSHSAWRSAGVASGGRTVPRPPGRSAAVRNRWCGVTSQVTGRPCCLAARTSRISSRVATWQTCRARPASAAARMAAARLRPSAWTHGRAGGGPAAQVLAPGGHVVQAQRAVGLVEVELEPGHARGERGGGGQVVEPGAEVLGVIAARLLPGGRQGQLQRGGIGDRRGGVGHGQHQGKAAGQGGGGAAVPIFFVGGAGFAQVHVRVDQAGESEHKGSLNEFHHGDTALTGPTPRTGEERDFYTILSLLYPVICGIRRFSVMCGISGAGKKNPVPGIGDGKRKKNPGIFKKTSRKREFRDGGLTLKNKSPRLDGGADAKGAGENGLVYTCRD